MKNSLVIVFLYSQKSSVEKLFGNSSNKNDKKSYVCVRFLQTYKLLKMNKGLKLGIELGLAVLIVVLVYCIYNTVMVDIKFGEEKAYREKLVIEKLQDARELQYAYESKFGKYADNWDELIRFAKEDSLEFTKTIGDIEDSVEVAEGRAWQEKVKIPAYQKLMEDSLLSKNFNLETINKVPGKNASFEIAAGTIICIKYSTIYW